MIYHALKSSIAVLFFININQAVKADEALRLLIGDYPPYTYQVDGKSMGVGYDAIVEIMGDMKMPFSIRMVPSFGRADVDMRKDTADGFFLATENPERNNVAEFSAPVMHIQWTWVWLKKRTDLQPHTTYFKKHAVVTTHANSNIEQWLQEKNYKVISGTPSIRDILSLLQAGRVDAVLLPEMTAKSVIKNDGLDPDAYSYQKELTLPFGIYINKKYLENHPDFMKKLNISIAKYQVSK